MELPWERKAAAGERIPPGLSLPEMMAYSMLRNLYSLYRNREITVDDAKQEKQRIIKSMERYKTTEAAGTLGGKVKWKGKEYILNARILRARDSAPYWQAELLDISANSVVIVDLSEVQA